MFEKTKKKKFVKKLPMKETNVAFSMSEDEHASYVGDLPDTFVLKANSRDSRLRCFIRLLGRITNALFAIIFVYAIAELLLLTFKLSSFELIRCIREELQPPLTNVTTFQLDAKTRYGIRAFCWLNGFHKERLRDRSLNSGLYVRVGSYRNLLYFRLDKRESDLIVYSAVLVYAWFTLQVILPFLKLVG